MWGGKWWLWLYIIGAVSWEDNDYDDYSWIVSVEDDGAGQIDGMYSLCDNL